ncbi:CRISPR-associated protein, Cse2 family [Marinobacterium lacunae]|uniref:CRISPR-associated protein, Cse2 family n=1 Tax=Marinobacterium lacunae TaxID=1232683 RepID=A0A081G1M8_9GAMM|nr:type I-E CRISPR-associated protein Cse2/CasB [Marinobacterium lacunae]KEA64683.1 CRISPR-associated protein, Cse2 family [Marinobacterium lacunae]MBR9884249.1 type I-E CRISPR-associated protein Cse2/CasB [Oceanospirillales bacterium]
MSEQTSESTKPFPGSATLHRWWKSMMLSPDELKADDIRPAPTVYRAELKRAGSPDAVLLTSGFRALWLSLPDEVREEKARPWTPLAWATVAGVLSLINTDMEGRFAMAVGQVDAETDKAKVSELRFAQLQGAKTPEDFYRRLCRIVRQLQGKVPVRSLAGDILTWYDEHNRTLPRRADKRLSVIWAMDYYRAAEAKH